MNTQNELLNDVFRKVGALRRRNRHAAMMGNYPNTQNRALSLLAMNDGMSQRQFAYLLGIRPQSTGEILNKLESNGYISRQPAENDGRVNLVYLTDEGRKQAAEIEKQQNEDIFDCLSDEEKEQLTALLGKIVENHPEVNEMRRPCPERGRMPHHGPVMVHGRRMPKAEIRNMPFFRPEMPSPEDMAEPDFTEEEADL